MVAHSVEPNVEPNAHCEQTGFFGQVVFTIGHTVDGDPITIYSGAADEVICTSAASLLH